MTPPPLSVVMPVFNALPYLDEAITSILDQTFADFEFVMLDDGSTDGSTGRLEHWAERDPRIRLVRSPVRLGPVESSNRVVAETRAPMVARMDADDIARPDRLKRQLALLQAQPDAVLVGALWEVVDVTGRKVRSVDNARLFASNGFAPFNHPTIMFSKKVFERIGGYRSGTEYWEDTDLYRRFASEGRILVIAEPLIKVRLSATSSRLRDGADRLERAMDRMHRRDQAVPSDGDGKLHPMSFVQSYSPVLWAGRRPKALGRLLRRGALQFDRATAYALLWMALADACPKTLRTFLRLLLGLRNWRAARRLNGREWTEWVPPQPLPARHSRAKTRGHARELRRLSGS